MTKEIRLTQNKFALVDDDDFERINIKKYHAVKLGRCFYAYKWSRGKNISMHRDILQALPGEMVDHINGNGLDNRKENLRMCNKAQNRINSGLQKNNTSGYKGVYLQCTSKKYIAHITVNKKCVHLGIFEDPIEAALSYDEAARKYHGIFARTNF